jgi:hypothetical protein
MNEIQPLDCSTIGSKLQPMSRHGQFFSFIAFVTFACTLLFGLAIVSLIDPESTRGLARAIAGILAGALAGGLFYRIIGQKLRRRPPPL